MQHKLIIRLLLQRKNRNCSQVLGTTILYFHILLSEAASEHAPPPLFLPPLSCYRYSHSCQLLSEQGHRMHAG